MTDEQDAIEGVVLRNFSDEELRPEKLINYSQNIRRQVADQLTSGGVPKTDDDLKMLLATLRDMDTTSIQSQKVDVDRAGVENDRAAQEIVKELARQRPYGLRIAPGEEEGVIPTPDLNDIPELTFSDAEKEQGVVKTTSKDFLREMDGDDETE